MGGPHGPKVKYHYSHRFLTYSMRRGAYTIMYYIHWQQKRTFSRTKRAEWVEAVVRASFRSPGSVEARYVSRATRFEDTARRGV